MALFLSFRYQAVGGPTRTEPVLWESNSSFAVKSLDISRIASLSLGRDILFAVHGYNNSQQEAVCSLSRLEAALNLPPSALFLGILWPGDLAFGAVSYPLEKPTAVATGRGLANFCNRKFGDAASLSFASHSLGARVTLEAIRRLDRRARTACLAAAAIERTCLEEEYSDAFGNVDVLSVMASKSDSVLRLAFPLGNVFGHLLNPTANPLSNALGFAGPARAIGKTVPPWQISEKDDYGHSDYLPPSSTSAVFPDAKGKWHNPAAFIRRTFDMQTQTWPT